MLFFYFKNLIAILRNKHQVNITLFQGFLKSSKTLTWVVELTVDKYSSDNPLACTENT